MGPRNLLARVYQSIPISITVEGANILTRSMIIFGQGAIRCHPYLLREVTAAHDKDHEQGAREFDRAFTSHIGFTTSNAVRAFLLGLTGSRIARVPGSSATQPCYRHLARMSAAFAFASDIALLVLGGSLKRKERLSARLADILSYLYLASAVLKRFEDQGSPKEDIPFLNWACRYTLYTMEKSLDALLKNFPNRYVAWFMRRVIFPWGKSYLPPDDKLDHSVADILLSHSNARDRLTEGIYIPDTVEESLRLMEDALTKVVAAEPAEKKIRKAIQSGVLKRNTEEETVKEAIKAGVINYDEAALLRDAIALRKEVVRVDDFSTDECTRADKNFLKALSYQ